MGWCAFKAGPEGAFEAEDPTVRSWRRVDCAFKAGPEGAFEAEDLTVWWWRRVGWAGFKDWRRLDAAVAPDRVT